MKSGKTNIAEFKKFLPFFFDLSILAPKLKG